MLSFITKIIEMLYQTKIHVTLEYFPTFQSIPVPQFFEDIYEIRFKLIAMKQKARKKKKLC